MTTEKKNLVASVHHRLHNYARANGEDFKLLFTREEFSPRNGDAFNGIISDFS